MMPDVVTFPIMVLSPHLDERQQIADWLRSAGLGDTVAVGTADEAIFMIGQGRASLLMIDEGVPLGGEQRLLRHLRRGNSHADPVLIRIVGSDARNGLAIGPPAAAEVIRKPLRPNDVVVAVGTALQRPDLRGPVDPDGVSDQAREHLYAARRMQIGLLPSPAAIRACEVKCGVGIAAHYSTGEAVGGDYWGIWPTGRGRFGLAIVDFAGHGLGAAVHTFRLHTLLTECRWPHGHPARITALLNAQLHALLPRGQYATMVYLHIDTIDRGVHWCSAGGPPPIFVTPEGAMDLAGCGMPLGIRAASNYRVQSMRLPDSGVLAVFSDGLVESGAEDPEIPRSAIAAALAEPARLATGAGLKDAANMASRRLRDLRGSYPSRAHSDDIAVVCVALGVAAPSAGGDLAHSAVTRSALSRGQRYRMNTPENRADADRARKRRD